MLKKFILFAFLLIALVPISYAEDVVVEIGDTTFDVTTVVGANYYISTVVNTSQQQWKAGDTVTLKQGNKSSTHLYTANGNFVLVSTTGGSSGSGGGGGGGGGGFGGGGFNPDPIGGGSCGMFEVCDGF